MFGKYLLLYLVDNFQGYINHSITVTDDQIVEYPKQERFEFGLTEKT